MKKMLLLLFILLTMCIPAWAEDDPYQPIHEYFKDFTDAQLEELKTILDVEIEYRKQQSKADDDTAMRDLICYYFESNGHTIKRVMFQPLIEKDDGLYGGKERWWITLENGDQFASWVKDDAITFFYNGIWYDDVPLY